MTMTMFVDAQDTHTNTILEEVLGRKLLNLQREATELLDQSLWLADHIWELEGEYLSSRGSVSSPCDRGKPLTPISEYDGGDVLDLEGEAAPTPSYDGPRDRDSDDNIHYQLDHMRAEAAELSKRSGEAWTRFCEGVFARLSPSSHLDNTAQRRSQKQKKKPEQMRLIDEGDKGEDEGKEGEQEDGYMSTTHADKLASHHYDHEDAELAEPHWQYSTSPHGNETDDVGSYDYDYPGKEEEDSQEQGDYEFRETIRQEYLQLAEQHLLSQAYEKLKQHLIRATTTSNIELADDLNDIDLGDDLEELPGLFEDLMKGMRHGDHDDSGYDEEEDDENNDDDTLTYLDLATDGIVCDDDHDSDMESFKSCFEDFDEE